MFMPFYDAKPANAELPYTTDLEMYFRADQGITESGGLVSQWDDLSGNSRNLTESTNKPTYSASGGPNSTPTLVFDGTNDQLTATGFTSFGSSQKHVYMIIKQVTWNSGDFIYRFDPTNESVRQDGTTPDLKQDDGATAGNTVSPTLGTYYLLQSFHNGTSTSFQQLNNGSAVTGTDPGNIGGSTDFYLAADDAGGRQTNIEVCELAIYSTQVTGSNATEVLSYFQTRYGLW